MAELRTMPSGEVKKKVKWQSKRRDGKSRRWKVKWITVKKAPKKKK
jgi:hypothetical protein